MGVAMWGIIWKAMESRYPSHHRVAEKRHSQAAAESQIISRRLADTKASLDASEQKLTELSKAKSSIAEDTWRDQSSYRNGERPIGIGDYRQQRSFRCSFAERELHCRS
jgi:hypothetical protein